MRRQKDALGVASGLSGEKLVREGLLESELGNRRDKSHEKNIYGKPKEKRFGK